MVCLGSLSCNLEVGGSKSMLTLLSFHTSVGPEGSKIDGITSAGLARARMVDMGITSNCDPAAFCTPSVILELLL